MSSLAKSANVIALGLGRAQRRHVGRRMRDDLAAEQRVARQDPEVPEHVQLWRRHRCDQADQKVIRLEDQRARAVAPNAF